MCFYITEKNPDPIIAAKNIVCFKVVFTDLKSFHQDFQYEVGETYKMNTKLKPVISYPNFFNHHTLTDEIIVDGFHSYVSKKEIIDKFSKYESSYHTLNVIILECVIPKGSTYYVSDSNDIFPIKLGEYVSDKIKPTRLINIVDDNDYDGQLKNEMILYFPVPENNMQIIK